MKLMDVLQFPGHPEIGKAGILRVSDLTCILMELIDGDARTQNICVRGEITNCTHHTSGHLYFSLVDSDSLVPCVMWRTDVKKLNFKPGNGMDVLVFGSLGVYAPQGRYQLYARDIRRTGEGEKHLLVEQWKRELQEQGFFAAEKKRPLPPYPQRIAVVTSGSGAVLHDIIHVIRRRYPLEILVSPTAVQGENAHRQIAEAIRRADGRAEVLIVARGGGSFEDLFPFNHPMVVKAIASCQSVVISAVGHEVDTTLSDYAADHRAATPSAAAERAVPDRSELLKLNEQEHLHMQTVLLKNIDQAREILEDQRMRLQTRRFVRRVDEKRQEISDLSDRLGRGMRHVTSAVLIEGDKIAIAITRKLERSRGEIEEMRQWVHPLRLTRRIGEIKVQNADLPDRLCRAVMRQAERERLLLAELRALLEGRNPRLLLSQGYCYVEKGARPVTSVRQLSPGDQITVHIRDGKSTVQVKGVEYGPEV
jgi:exodeoxyribonuclease VII large subunit